MTRAQFCFLLTPLVHLLLLEQILGSTSGDSAQVQFTDRDLSQRSTYFACFLCARHHVGLLASHEVLATRHLAKPR